MEHEERTKLRQLLGKHFSVEELKILVFDLQGVDYDELPGESKSGKILGLIEYLERRGQEDDLLRLAAGERPDVDWPSPSAQQRPEPGQVAQFAVPEFDRLVLGDNTVRDTVGYLQRLFDSHDPGSAGALPEGLLAEMGRLFRRYTFCKPLEECDTQVWGTRLLAIIETHDVLTTLDSFLFQTGLKADNAEVGALRADLGQVAYALHDYGQALTAYFGPALDWQEAKMRLEAEGYDVLWNDLDQRKLTRESLDDDVRRRCEQSFWRLRVLLDGFDALQASC